MSWAELVEKNLPYLCLYKLFVTVHDLGLLIFPTFFPQDSNGTGWTSEMKTSVTTLKRVSGNQPW